jgi:hypothetical protein
MTVADQTLLFTLGLIVGVSLVAVPLAVHKYLTTFPKSRTPQSGGGKGNLSQSEDDQSTNVVYRLASSSVLEKLENDFRVPTSKLHDIVRHFTSELNKGLHSPGQTIKALPSYVDRLPTGKERGTFLALDLGGTNLRVCEVVLEGHGKFRMRQKKYKISDQVRTLLSHTHTHTHIALLSPRIL